MYTSYDVARQLLQVRNYVEVHASGFAELPKDVLSAMLHLTAEWRNVDEMEMLIQMGADPRETHGGFTVLEVFVQGHDGYWCGKDSVTKVEDGVKMLAKYGVTDKDLTHRWILSNCEDIIKNSEYLSTFFKVETPVLVHYHVPRADQLTLMDRTFTSVEDAVKSLPVLTDHKQYIAVIEDQGAVTRYLVSKGCGLLELIPIDDKPGWTVKEEMISNIVNFVMGCDEFPTLPCEDDEE
jgi:hypothetical protein